MEIYYLEISTGIELGDIKYEGKENVRIENVNKIIAYQLI
jgi:hypothetical protein